MESVVNLHFRRCWSTAAHTWSCTGSRTSPPGLWCTRSRSWCQSLFGTAARLPSGTAVPAEREQKP